IHWIQYVLGQTLRRQTVRIAVRIKQLSPTKTESSRRQISNNSEKFGQQAERAVRSRPHGLRHYKQGHSRTYIFRNAVRPGPRVRGRQRWVRAIVTAQLRMKQRNGETGPSAPIRIRHFRDNREAFHEVVLYPAMEVHR